MTSSQIRYALFAMLLCTPEQALAETAKEAREARAVKFVEAGIALLKANDLEGARNSFLKARDLVPDKANPNRFLGLVEARLGHCKEAVASLDLFLAKVPTDDPRTVEAITVRDRCNDELAPKTGAVVVETTPPGAEVRIDDDASAPAGHTPWKGEPIAAGSHVAFVRKPDFKSASRGFVVKRKETTTVHFDLLANPIPSGPSIVEKQPASSEPVIERHRRPWWIIGVAGGVVVAAAVGVGLGIGLSSREPVFTPVGAGQ